MRRRETQGARRVGWTPYELLMVGLLLIGSFGPNKLLPYAAPLVIIGAAILLRRDLVAFWRLLIIALLFAASAATSYLMHPDVAFSNVVLSFVTFSALYLYVLSPMSVVPPGILRRLPSLMHWLLIVEGLIGIVQAASGALQGGFDLNNGDRVEGTIHLPLPAENAFSNVMFTANVAFMLLFLAPYYAKRRYLASLVIGGTAFLLASVVHLMLMLVGAFVIAAGMLFLIRRNKKAVQYIFVIGLFFAPAPLLLSTNFDTLPQFVDQFATGASPKALLTERAGVLMPMHEILFPWVGLGPGQFSGRAGLIMTGRYLGGFNSPRPVLGIAPHTTQPQERYLIDVWASSAKNRYNGSTQQPFFSWLTVYTEFGLMACLGAVALVLYWTLRVNVLPSGASSIQRVALTTSMLLLFFTGFQENYWEVPQAIMLGILLQKVAYFAIRYGEYALPEASGRWW